ncbi:MAG TPA: DUF2784 domain-containing protein [Steroidobacteraceae bacterium]|nr:DUF2784 domain-containing protein [Steroidobacteraceae bacterium]
MDWKLLADAVVLVHLAFVAFVVGGGFLTWRYRLIPIAHLPALAWGIWIEWSGWICPLTPLENHLRERAGQSGYSGGFIEHYIIPVLYPPGLTHEVQWVLAAVLIAVNVVAYGKLMASRRSQRA